MPYLENARNFMLEQLAAKIKAISVLEAKPVEGVTWKTAAGHILKASGKHELKTNDLIVLTVAGGTGLVSERAYYVKIVGVEGTSTEIELFQGSGLATPEEWTTEVTSATVNKLVELKTTRVGITLGAPLKGLAKDVTPHTIAILGTNSFPCSYEYVGFYSATEAGTLYGVMKVPKETLAAAGSAEVKEAGIELEAVA